MIPCEILKQKHFLRKSCFKGFARFQINVGGGVHLQKSFKNQVFNFTKNRFRFAVPQKSHFVDNCSKLLQLLCNATVFLVVTRVFNSYFFRWWYREMTSNRLFNNSSINYDLYLPFIFQDICEWSFFFASFHYSVDDILSFLFFSLWKVFYDLRNVS